MTRTNQEYPDMLTRWGQGLLRAKQVGEGDTGIDLPAGEDAAIGTDLVGQDVMPVESKGLQIRFVTAVGGGEQIREVHLDTVRLFIARMWAASAAMMLPLFWSHMGQRKSDRGDGRKLLRGNHKVVNYANVDVDVGKRRNLLQLELIFGLVDPIRAVRTSV